MQYARLLVAASFLAAAPTFAAPPVQSDREVLLALEAKWNKAISDRDAAIAAEIISEDFRYIAPTGQVFDRNAVLKATGDPDYKIEPFKTEEVEVRVHGDTAVVTGRFTQVGSYKGEPSTVRMRYTDVYVRQGESWRAISAHSSLIR